MGPAQRTHSLERLRYATRSPTITVTACPPSTTRSPRTRTFTTPPRAEAWNAVNSLLPRVPAQYGPSAVGEVPVTGSSSAPAPGAENSETKSNLALDERAVTITPRTGTLRSVKWSGDRARTVSSESTSTRQSNAFLP